MTDLLRLTCDSCGAPLPQLSQDKTQCEYCGTNYSLVENTLKKFTPVRSLQYSNEMFSDRLINQLTTAQTTSWNSYPDFITGLLIPIIPVIAIFAYIFPTLLNWLIG